MKKIDRRKFLTYIAGAGVLTAAGIYYFNSPSSKAKGKIVIIGGGAAGLSMGARLSRILKNPDIVLIDPSDRQYYQPGFTFVASGVYKPTEVWKEQKNCIPAGVEWIKDKVVELDPVNQKVTTALHGMVDYDFLVLTPGLQINWNGVEGITYDTLGTGNAHCIYDFEGAQKNMVRHAGVRPKRWTWSFYGYLYKT